MNNLPEPLTPADCDLRDFAYMPLDAVRLRDSDLAIKAKGEEFRAAVLLWCVSWHQIPAGSLPDDQTTLAAFVGFGRTPREWTKYREGALRGWIKCSDGRLYHPVVAEKAKDAWTSKLKQRFRTECARIKKHCQRNQIPYEEPDFDDWMSQGCPQGQKINVPGTNKKGPEDKEGASPGCPPGNAIQEKGSKGKGEGREGINKTKDAPVALAIELPDWLPPDAWQGFVEMRRKTKHPLTDHAASLIVAELEKLMQAGNRPRLVLEQSVMNSWRGVFPLKAPRLLGDAQSRDAFNERENARAKELLFGPEDGHATG